jgi:hypothetical protein
MVPFSGTSTTPDGDLNSFNATAITIKVIKERINAAQTGNIFPKIVEPKIAANAGPTINPRLEDMAILPKLLLLFSFDDISARYALATEIFPPVSPSINLARNNTSNGRVITKDPRRAELTLKIFSLGKNNATRKKSSQQVSRHYLKEVSFFFHKYQTIYLILEPQ